MSSKNKRSPPVINFHRRDSEEEQGGGWEGEEGEFSKSSPGGLARCQVSSPSAAAASSSSSSSKRVLKLTPTSPPLEGETSKAKSKGWRTPTKKVFFVFCFLFFVFLFFLFFCFYYPNFLFLTNISPVNNPP